MRQAKGAVQLFPFYRLRNQSSSDLLKVTQLFRVSQVQVEQHTINTYSILSTLSSPLSPEFWIEPPSLGKSKYLEILAHSPQPGTAVMAACTRFDRETAAGRASSSETPPSGGPSRKAPAATGLRSRTLEIPSSGAVRWEPGGTPARC